MRANAVVVGIDWADQEHVVCIIDHNDRSKIDTLRAAVPLTRDKAIIEPNALYAQMLASQIQDLSNTIEQLEGEIATVVGAHPDDKIFRALPGAGDALVPRLIAAFGSDRDRYDSAEEIQCYSGIAPVTRQSGKTRHVSRRYACPNS